MPSAGPEVAPAHHALQVSDLFQLYTASLAAALNRATKAPGGSAETKERQGSLGHGMGLQRSSQALAGRMLIIGSVCSSPWQIGSCGVR